MGRVWTMRTFRSAFASWAYEGADGFSQLVGRDIAQACWPSSASALSFWSDWTLWRFNSRQETPITWSDLLWPKHAWKTLKTITSHDDPHDPEPLKQIFHWKLKGVFHIRRRMLAAQNPGLSEGALPTGTVHSLKAWSFWTMAPKQTGVGQSYQTQKVTKYASKVLLSNDLPVKAEHCRKHTCWAFGDFRLIMPSSPERAHSHSNTVTRHWEIVLVMVEKWRNCITIGHAMHKEKLSDADMKLHKMPCW